MGYLVYESQGSDTLKSVADYYGVAIQDLARINNIPEPWFEYTVLEPGMQVIVPDLQNGRETLENRNFTGMNFTTGYVENNEVFGGLSGQIGFASQFKCYLTSSQGTIYFPCYPESYSDSHQASMASQTPLGRSEPFLIYQNSGPRTVNVSFRMDREMTHVTDIGAVVGYVQSMCYPAGEYATIIPRCTLVIGNNCSITGVIQSVNTNWSDTIIANQYMVVTLDFSVTECTGHPKTANTVFARRGR